MIPRRPVVVAWAAVGLGACAGAPPVADPIAAPAAPYPPTVAPPIPLCASPDIDLRARNTAEVRGRHVVYDGLAEGLAWPSLDHSLGPRDRGSVLALQAARDVRVVDVLRAAWTLRTGDLRVQTPDASGVMRAAELRAKPATGAPGCHLAVFLRPDGSLRLASPAGRYEVSAERAAERLVHSLEEERARCAVKYVAFGAESDEAPWGPVFDVIVAVDRARSAGDARYVLAQAMRR